MKRNLLIVAIALLAVAFVSCQKDGVYKPKEKIAKVYKEWTRTEVTTEGNNSRTETSTQPRYVAEEWNWGDKTLSSILFKDTDGSSDGNVIYTYDKKNRIEGMTFDGGKVEYTYNDDNRVSSIKYYEDNELGLSYDIEYDGKLPVKVTMTEYWGITDMSNIAKSLTPSYILKYIELKKNELASKATRTYTITSTIEWDGKNISQVVTTGEDNTPVTTTYEYDNNINPYCGMYGNEYVLEGANLNFAYSKNNVVKETRSYTENNKTITTTDEYTYEYDGKYPTSVSYTYVYEYSYSTYYSYKTTTVYTTTYEYK